MNILDLLVGKPWDTEERPSKSAAPGIPIFGLDALSSAAYGRKQRITLLIPWGSGLNYILPISAQHRLPSSISRIVRSSRLSRSGGSFRRALIGGTSQGLLAAAALLTDYILTAAWNSAGVGAANLRCSALQPIPCRFALGFSLCDDHQPFVASRSRRLMVPRIFQ